MTRTKPIHLVVLAIAGLVIAWFAQVVLAATGNAILVPPVTLAVALALIGVLIVVMALPVWRVTRGRVGARVDPFYATRVVALAKASSLSGALLGGAGLGIVAYLVTRSIIPGMASVALAFASLGGAIVLLVAGIVAENMCTIPPSDDDSHSARSEK